MGVVLWWDERDRNGVVKGSDGKRYYFDLSVVDSRTRTKIQAGTLVKFEKNPKIKDTLCARALKPVVGKEKTKVQRVLNK
jgi:hypothetical protein